MRPSSAPRRTLVYTCAFCERRQASDQFRARKQLLHNSNPPILNKASSGTIAHRSVLSRSLHQTHSPAVSEQIAVSSTSDEQVPHYSFSILPKQSKVSSSSQIRQSFRAWSEQNERSKQERNPEALPYQGKITRLPNSLFIDIQQDVPGEEEEQDEPPLGEDGDEESIYRGAEMILPGTLLSFRSALIRRQNVVYLGDIGNQSLFLLSDGRWAAEKLANKRAGISTYRHVDVPGFLTSEEVDSLRAHMPKRDVVRAVEPGATPSTVGVMGSLPDDVVVPILPKLKEFRNSEQRFLRNHKAQLEQMYSNLAYEDKWRTISVKELPQIVLGVEYEALSWVAKKAFVHYANVFHPLFVATQTASTVTYYIGPKSLHRNMKSVESWARLYQEAAAQAALGKNVSSLLSNNPLSSFIDKARRIIMKSRKIRTPTSMGVLGPAFRQSRASQGLKSYSEEEFTTDDSAIISYLWDVALRRPISRNTLAHASLIVRAVGAYPNLELDGSTFRMLLQELGCADPWGTHEDIATPLPGTRASPHLDLLHLEALQSIKSIQSMNENGNMATTFSDSMAHMRKDWGDMEVLCIDKPQAENIEDAISIEAAHELEGGYWFHTHFAHPTAHLPVDHPIVKFARKRGSAYYGPYEGKSTELMVPSPVIGQFSIRNGSPVITVSSLITMDGNVHDIQVVPGTVRNVQRVDRNALNIIMGIPEPEQAVLVVGKVSSLPKEADLGVGRSSKEDIEGLSEFLPKLRLMNDLLAARRARRAQEVEVPARFYRTSSTLSIKTRLPEKYRPDRESESYHWQGDPGIVVWGNRKFEAFETHDEHRAADITAQAMRLAAESLGKWLAGRNIPAIFLGNSPPAGFSIQEVNEKGPYAEVAKPVFTRTSYAKPLFHHNMKQYAPCTSPLRKYLDMVNHFQIDSYLKAEADGLLHARVPEQDDSRLAFSRQDIEKYLAQDAAAGDALDDLSRQTKLFWAFQALFRAFHFKEAELPEVLEMIIDSPTQRNAHGLIEPASGRLIPWSLPVTLEPSANGYEHMAKIRECIPVKLISVDPSRGIVNARATGPPTSEQQILGSIMCYNSSNVLDSASSIISSQSGKGDVLGGSRESTAARIPSGDM